MLDEFPKKKKTATALQMNSKAAFFLKNTESNKWYAACRWRNPPPPAPQQKDANDGNHDIISWRANESSSLFSVAGRKRAWRSSVTEAKTFPWAHCEFYCQHLFAASVLSVQMLASVYVKKKVKGGKKKFLSGSVGNSTGKIRHLTKFNTLTSSLGPL